MAVWRCVQAGGVLVDVCMSIGAVKMLIAEERLMDVGPWRGHDWKNLVGNVVMGVFRVRVALGIGDGQRKAQSCVMKCDCTEVGNRPSEVDRTRWVYNPILTNHIVTPPPAAPAILKLE